jgi:hypothetical protein
VQLAMQVDTEKMSLEGKVDLREVLGGQAPWARTGLVVGFKNGVKMGYGIRGRMTQQQASGALSCKEIKEEGREGCRKADYATIESKKTITFKSTTLLPNDDDKENNDSGKATKKFHSSRNIKFSKEEPRERENSSINLEKQGGKG